MLGEQPYAVLITNAILLAVIALIHWLLYLLISSAFKALSKRVLSEDRTLKPLRIQKQEILSSFEVAKILNGGFTALSWILRIIIVISFLNMSLGLFVWTQNAAAAGMQITGNAIRMIWQGFVDYLPDLVTTLVIVFVAHLFLKLLKLVFEGIRRRRITIPGFYPEWAKTSFSLMRLLVIALTIVVVFPYLPGSGSPAFQGVSIFVGVLLSLGSTTAVANVVAGIVITFTRAFKKGDQVVIADTEGKVIERTAFVTRLRTSKNVDVSIPNAAIMSDKVINFSTQAKQTGITLHTGVTIGYDVPWTRVHELLLAAANATEHLESEPAPFVLQKALDDYYVAYELNVCSRRSDIRPVIYSELHANILDAFHAAGVEITSPHYRAVRNGNEPAIAGAQLQDSTGQAD